MKAMILAAGKGTRMMPLTLEKPKPLIEIQGVSLLEHTIRYLKFYGFKEIIINIHHFPEQIVDFLRMKRNFGVSIEFSDESDELLDTGGGLLKARWYFDDGPFLLTSSDVITNLNLKNMMDFHVKNKCLATLAVKHRKSSRDFIFDQESILCGWRDNGSGETRMIRDCDKKDPIAFSTIHIIDPKIFNYIQTTGKFSIIDTYLELAAHFPIMGFVHDHSQWFECGRIENMAMLNGQKEIKDIYDFYHLTP